MEALVSVIIPVYNVSPYLREALDSVIHQTYKNLEILVIDDGSTDNSGVICDEYLSDPRVRVIHQENRGLSGARNTGLDHATGDYIAFLDSDDAFHPDMINLLLQSLFRNNADLSVCAYTAFKYIHPKTARNRYRDISKTECILSARESFISLLEKSFPVNVWSKLYQRRLWEHLRFPERYVYEDTRVTPFLLGKCNNIVVLPQSLVYHRLREGSITHTDTEKNLQDNISAFRMVLAYANTVQPPLPRESIAKYQEEKLRYLIFIYTKLLRSEAFYNSPSLKDILSEEIRNLSGDKPEFLQRKTKVVWWLYQHCPDLLIPAKTCFWFLKRLYRKCRRTDFMMR